MVAILFLDSSSFLSSGSTRANFLSWVREYFSEMDEFDSQVF